MPGRLLLGDGVGAVDVGVHGVVAELALVLVVLRLGVGDLVLGVRDLLVQAVELDLGLVGGLGVALDDVVELVDLGGDGVGLGLFVSDRIGARRLRESTDRSHRQGRQEQRTRALSALHVDHGTRTVANAWRMLRTGDEGAAIRG